MNSQQFLDPHSKKHHEHLLNFFCSSVYLPPASLKVMFLEESRGGVAGFCLLVVTC